jgi:hypothetical protein
MATTAITRKLDTHRRRLEKTASSGQVWRRKSIEAPTFRRTKYLRREEFSADQTGTMVTSHLSDYRSYNVGVLRYPIKIGRIWRKKRPVLDLRYQHQ